MKKHHTLIHLSIALLGFAATAVAAPPAPADIGIPRNSAGAQEAHKAFIERGKQGPVGLLFVGDSLTSQWERQSSGLAVWEKYYNRYQPANFGYSGDPTQHIIWRLENGELASIAPKAVVLLAGTNNSGSYDAAQILAGIKKIISVIQNALPDSRLILVSIPPRGQGTRSAARDNSVEKMKVINAVNQKLPGLADGKKVYYVDIASKLADAKGNMLKQYYQKDEIHFTKAGYELWAETMQPILDQCMKAK